MLRILTLFALLWGAHSFTLSPSAVHIGQRHSSFLGAAKIKERVDENVDNLADSFLAPNYAGTSEESSHRRPESNLVGLASLGAVSFLTAMTVFSEESNAAISMPIELTLSSGSFDPQNFVPVCPASDGLYRIFQGSAKTIVGADNFQEYGPLIASGLLRVRLELCVVESFFNEAVGPFIRQNGLSWVLPIHETVETFLAGTVFALATTFILVGSTKILTVILTYADFLVGAPLRLFGGFAFDRARGKPVVLDIGFGPFKQRVIGPKDVVVDENDDWSIDFADVGPGELPILIVSGSAKVMGTIIKILREVLDAIDLFVGKSLVLWVTAYIGIKFLHFKVFPDFPPF